MSVTLSGAEEIDAYFKSLPTSVAKNGMRNATRQVARLVLATAVALAPEDTGGLAKSLKVRAAKRRRKRPPWIVESVVRTGEESLFRGDQYYGGFLEFGTVEREHKSGKKVGRIDDSVWAYLLPAILAFAGTKLQIFRDALVAWINSQRDAVKPKRRKAVKSYAVVRGRESE